MAIYTLDGKPQPQIGKNVWIAPNATVIGDIRLADDVSIWWNVVLRGDNDPIEIGAGTNIQDGSVLHTDEGFPMRIGSRVTVGHMAMLHGCTVGEGSLIGIGSIVLNGAVIGKNSMVGANTLIPPGKVYPDRVLIVGSPGKVVRELSDDDIKALTTSANNYVANASRYRNGLQQLEAGGS